MRLNDAKMMPYVGYEGTKTDQFYVVAFATSQLAKARLTSLAPDLNSGVASLSRQSCFFPSTASYSL